MFNSKVLLILPEDIESYEGTWGPLSKEQREVIGKYREELYCNVCAEILEGPFKSIVDSEIRKLLHEKGLLNNE